MLYRASTTKSLSRRRNNKRQFETVLFSVLIGTSLLGALFLAVLFVPFVVSSLWRPGSVLFIPMWGAVCVIVVTLWVTRKGQDGE